MKKLFKWSTLLLAATVLFQVSCDNTSDPVPEALPDPTGKWFLSSTTLVDGDASTTDIDDLVVSNALGQGPATIEAGDTQLTFLLISGFLLNAACDEAALDADGYFLELTKEDGVQKLYFGCIVGTNVTSTESGSWSLVKDGDSYTITLNVAVGGTTLPINFVNFELAASTTSFTGTAVGYPMVKDALVDIGTPLPDESLNIQFLIADMEYIKLP